MKRCSSPAHPHCTVWVAPGTAACAHGHPQPAQASATGDALGSSFDMLSRLRADRLAGTAIRPRTEHGLPVRPAMAAPAARPHLHVSGFDPRAAGGRHAIRLELRGLPADAPADMTLLLQSDLLPLEQGPRPLARSLDGGWRPLFLEFSSRGREHGQYRIDVELHARDALGGDTARTWVATLVLLVPRADASLGEIHQTFLSTHKNVRISADDGSIARLQGLGGGGPMDIDIHARNAGIARVEFDAARQDGGKIAVGLPTIAWDEDLIEIDLPAARAHPAPASSGCLVYAEPEAGFQRHLRLFALDECVLGRHEAAGAEADLLLQHHDERGAHADGLTRRLSGRHALIRAGRNGFEIEDVSRYGLLLDGVWPGKHVPVQLRPGMRIELTASIRGVVTLVVSAVLAHAVVLHRVDAGGAAEAFMLMAPGVAPETVSAAGASLPRAAHLPLLFHRDGGFWHRDRATGQDTPLSPATALERLSGFHGRVRFAAQPRPDDAHRRGSVGERRRAPPSVLFG
nr:FHA domain-containing protein [uncultured Massilia sp.]